jgi:hypothetical protein
MTSEADLFAGYLQPSGIYRAGCICGLWIVSNSGKPEDVEKAIELHQLSTVHRRWRAWQLELARTPPVRYGP